MSVGRSEASQPVIGSQLLSGLWKNRTQFFGMVDAGLSSFATFLVGLFAARVFNPSELGAYALCFSAVFLAGIVPGQGYFFPAENLLVGLPQADRLRELRLT